MNKISILLWMVANPAPPKGWLKHVKSIHTMVPLWCDVELESETLS